MKKTLLAVLLLSSLTTLGCGGSSPSAPAPTAIVTATGLGSLVFHPSAQPQRQFALAIQMRMQEINGGSAEWRYARLRLFRNGVEVERVEHDAAQIGAQGWTRVTPLMDQIRTLVFRHDDIDINGAILTFGFVDTVGAREFVLNVPFNTFVDVHFDPAPLALPADQPLPR